MAYQGYLSLGSIELMNAERTAAYVRHMAPDWDLRHRYPAPQLAELLNDGEYRSPALDGADWFSPYEPDSERFLGWYPTSWTGFEDSSLSTNIVELVAGGGAASSTRAGSKDLKVKGVLLALDEAGLEYGMSWLRGVFEDADCRGSVGCAGEELTFLASTPSACEEGLGSSQDGYQECLIPFLRQYHQVSVLQGPKVTTRFTRDSCIHLVEVEVILNAGKPYIYTWPIYAGQSQEGPSRIITNLARNPQPTSELDYSPSPGHVLGVISQRIGIQVPDWGGEQVYIDMDVPGAVPGTTYTLEFSGLQAGAASGGAQPPRAGRVAALYRTGGPSQTEILSEVLWGTSSGGEETTLRWQFDLPELATDLTIRFYSPRKAGFLLTNLLVANAEDLGSDGFFSGDSPDTVQWTYDWTGTPNESASIAEFNPAPPFVVPNEVCDPTADPVVLRRNRATVPRAMGNDPTGNSTWYSTAGARYPVRGYVAANDLRPGAVAAHSERLDLAEGAPTIAAGLSWAGGWIPVTPGETITWAVSAKCSRANWQLRTICDAADASGTIISEGVAYTGLPQAADTWARMGSSRSMPTGAAYARVRIYTVVEDGVQVGDESWFADSLVLSGVTANPNDLLYFDGSTTADPEHRYQWEGEPYQSSSVEIAQEIDLLRDPDCTFVPLPPQPPAIMDDCIETPESWTRYYVEVPPGTAPGYAAAPVVTITAGEDDARQIRVRVYPDDGNGGARNLDECSYDSEFIITYLPAGTAMTVDARVDTATVEFGGGVSQRSGLHLLRGSEGKPFSWPLLHCHERYVITVDFSPEALGARADFWLSGRA